MVAVSRDVDERPWFIIRRWQEYEGEGRTNLLRVLAIGGYYAIHLITHLGIKEPSPDGRHFHRLATLVACAGLFLALAVLVSLQRQYLPAALKFLTTAFDLLLITSLAAIGSGPQSPLVLAYFVVIASSALRFSLLLVWAASLGAMACYLTLVGLKDPTWFDGDHATPPATQLSMLLSLGLTGIVLGQVLRRVKAVAIDRSRPKEVQA